MRRLRFVRCNEFHMRVIDRWMTTAYNFTDDVTFYNNRHLLWENMDDIWVLLDGLKVVGFYLDTDIMEVRPSERGKGYGTRIAKRMIQNAIRRDVAVLEFEILPQAIEFWEKMGFETYLRKVFYARMNLKGTKDEQQINASC